MKARAKSADLSRGIKSCHSAIDTRDIAYSNIQIEAEGSELIIRATNTQYAVYFHCDAEVEEEGVAVVDGRMACNVIAKAPEYCSFSTDETNLIIKANGRTKLVNARHKIPVMAEATGKTVVCDSGEFKNAVIKIQYAISEDQSRAILTGAHFVSDGVNATLTGLDGFRMAQTHFKCNGDAFDVVISSRVLLALCEAITSGELKISTNGARIQFELDRYYINALLLAGKYVDTDRLMPSEFKTDVRLNVSDIKDMIASALIVSSKNNLVKICVAQDRVSFSSNSEIADFHGDIDAMTNGEDISIAFNLKYLNQAIAHINSDNCNFKMNTPSSPVIITPLDENKNNDLHLLLPVRVFNG